MHLRLGTVGVFTSFLGLLLLPEVLVTLSSDVDTVVAGGQREHVQQQAHQDQQGED